MVEVLADDGLPLVWEIADVDVDLVHSYIKKNDISKRAKKKLE